MSNNSVAGMPWVKSAELAYVYLKQPCGIQIFILNVKIWCYSLFHKSYNQCYTSMEAIKYIPVTESHSKDYGEIYYF